MVHATYSADVWPAPTAGGPLEATVRLPGSKSLTNRELVLSALADGPSRLREALFARDTDLMVAALRSFGVGVERDGDDLVVTPGALAGGTAIDVGLAGTLMRFLPPLAALADGPVRFDGDERARLRPMATTILSLRALGVEVDDEGRATMPFTVRGTGRVQGGPVLLDASESSQFVSGLLLSGARFEDGLEVEHRGARLPSLPHIEMTIDALRGRGVTAHSEVDAATGLARWTVPAHAITGRDLAIEPDLSNAGPFLAAAIVAGGWVSVPGWPDGTTQVGDRLRDWLAEFGAEVELRGGSLTVAGQGRRSPPPPAGRPRPQRRAASSRRRSSGSPRSPTAPPPSPASGTSAATRRIVWPRSRRSWERSASRSRRRPTASSCTAAARWPGIGRGAATPTTASRTTGALIGLATPGLAVEDVATTAKTLPGFVDLWARMLS